MFSLINSLVLFLLHRVPEVLVQLIEVLLELLLRVRKLHHLRVLHYKLIQVLLEI